MTWIHSDYLLEEKPKERRLKLAQHIIEVSDVLMNFQARSLSGMSYSKFQLDSYLKTLNDRLEKLDDQLGNSRPRPRAAFYGL